MLTSTVNKVKSLSSFFRKKQAAEVLSEQQPLVGRYSGKALLDYYNANRPAGPQKYICSAPVKSIYFESQGRAVACCVNRQYTLGSYPEMSIHDIWFGQKADEFRKLIKNNDLSQGCQVCHEQINAGNFIGAMSSSFDRYKLNANAYPSVIQFELSNVCNLECQMCNGDFSSLIRAKREKLPPLKAAYDMGFVHQLEEFIPYLEETSFLGGEPFLIDLYYEIWQSTIRINPSVKIKVQTNGTVLNNRVKDILAKGNFLISVSVDSLQKENYENIRKNAHFEAVSNNILYFNNYCKERNIELGIAVTPMRQNWKELPNFIRFGNQLNASVYFNNLIFPAEMSLKTLPHEELATMIAYLSEHTFPSNTPVQKNNRLKYVDFLNQIKLWYKQAGGTMEIKTELPHYYFAKDIADFKSHVVEQIDGNESISTERKQEQINNVSAKLTLLEKALDMPFSESRMAKFNLATNLTVVANHIETMPVEALIKMLK